METLSKFHALKSIFLEPCGETILLKKCNSSIIEDCNNKFKEVEKVQKDFRNIIVEEDLEAEKSEIFELSEISEYEKKLSGPCSTCESESSAPEASITQAYQDIANSYHHKKSFFYIVKENNRNKLLIYNTEIESQASIILDIPEPLGWGTCITQLPNGKLFCFGNYFSGITLLIGENYRVQRLPSGTACCCSSAIYYNNSVYCFGGLSSSYLTLSIRFDLDRNQWCELTSLPRADSCCTSVIFNGDILISGIFNRNILRYSIDCDSFSAIPYDFGTGRRKILVNADRLFMFECGSMYECEIGSDTLWRKITNRSIIGSLPYQAYSQCHNQEIYIGFIENEKLYCYKLGWIIKDLLNWFKNSLSLHKENMFNLI